MKKLSLVISVYNEEAVLEKFYNAFCNIEQDLKYGGEMN
jgi:glycosyltransferase involved in cell wall biosynthesis